LPSYPQGAWYFNPFTWQLLFVLGAWFAVSGTSSVRAIIQSRLAVAAAIAFLLFALVMTLAAQLPQLRVLVPEPVYDLFNPNDKTNLAPYRVVHLLLLAMLAVRFVPIDWSGAKSPWLAPVLKCGQQSLEVFCVGVFLSFIAHFALEVTVDTLASQLAVGAAGLTLMSAVAYYRSWSKRVDKPVAIGAEGAQRREQAAK
jgi:hypothetical protein